MEQTYNPRELLILADGDDVRDLVPDEDGIRLVHLEGRADIGSKRNFGSERACGEVIISWDDDDWSAPGRIADQVDRLMKSGKALTTYSSMEFRSAVDRWQYRGGPECALGTSLCYRRDWWQAHPFPTLQVGEDDKFVKEAYAAGQLVAADAGELMWASNHPENTSPRQLTGSCWRRL